MESLLEKRLCTSTRLKTELIEDAVQMEIFHCWHIQFCGKWNQGNK